MTKRLVRSSTDVKFLGVCGGIAEYFNIDSTLIRIIWLFLIIMAGTGCVLYIIFAIIMPKDDGYIDADFRERNQEN